MRNETASRTFLLFLSHIFSWKLKGQFSQLVKDFFFFFPPSLCHLMLSSLWKQQIYAWSWTGKNWTLLTACGYFAMKSSRIWWKISSRSNQRIFNNVSVFTGDSSRQGEGARAQLGAPQNAQDSLCCEGERMGKDCHFFDCILWTQCARARHLQSEPREEDFFAI